MSNENIANVTNCLINLGNDEFINISQIKKVKRCGNYCHIWIEGESTLRQIWDENRFITDQLNGL